MKKRIITLVLALMMCLSLVPITAFAANNANVTDIRNVGDTITFGGYYGKPIVWQVHSIDTNAGKALLIPQEMVGYWSFNDVKEDTTWEKSSIRTWLNTVFLNNAFSDSERAVILESDIDNKANSQHSVGGSANTKDKVFLLSEDEAIRYFSSDSARVAKVNFTQAQIENLAKALSSRSNPSYSVTYDDAVAELTSYNGTTDWWWLRTSGRELVRAAAVSYSGELYAVGNEVEEPYGGLRPAIWVNIKQSSLGNTSDWAKSEIEKADTLGLLPESLKGQDLTKPITRAEFAAVAVKVYENLSSTTTTPSPSNTFTDTQDNYVLRAHNTGLMVGVSDDKFDPNTILNRESAATALTRVLKRAYIPGWTFATDGNYTLNYTRHATFADDANISSWAKDSVYFMAANSIILGVGNNSFAPRAVTSAEQAAGYASATREAAIIIGVRLVENMGGKPLDYTGN